MADEREKSPGQVRRVATDTHPTEKRSRWDSTLKTDTTPKGWLNKGEGQQSGSGSTTQPAPDTSAGRQING